MQLTILQAYTGGQKLVRGATREPRRPADKGLDVRCLSDMNNFVRWARKQGLPLPKTVFVERGMKIPNTSTNYPMVLKEASGGRMFVCRNPRQLKEAVAAFGSVSFQVQPHLIGYTFYWVRYAQGSNPLVTTKKVVCKDSTEVEETDSNLRSMVIGITRKMADACFGLGATVFSFNVAISGNTALAISFNPDCVSPRRVL